MGNESLVTASAAITASGLAPATFKKYVDLGKIPFAETTEAGWKKFNVEHVLAAMERHNIKPNAKADGGPRLHKEDCPMPGDSQPTSTSTYKRYPAGSELPEENGQAPDVPQTDEEVPPAEEPVAAVATEAQAAIKKALRRAGRAFQRSLLETIDATSPQPDQELILLRLHARAEGVFEAVGEELCS